MAKARILVVEDESATALDIRTQPEDLGDAVQAALFSGQEAINTVETTQPDLVLTDFQLRAAIDSVEAVQHLDDHLDIPIVCLTAFADECTIRRPKATAPLVYLLKPFEEQVLYWTIETALHTLRTDRQRTVFLAMVSHDNRNPLDVIMDYTEMQDEEPSSRSTTESNRLLQQLKATVVTPNALVTKYPDVSRTEAGHITLAKKPLRFATLLQQLRRQYESETQCRQIQLEVLVQDQFPQLSADDIAMERLISNLLSNASKFTAQCACITLSAHRQGPDIVVTVKDTGPGIPADDISFLFNQYWRTTATQPQQSVGVDFFIVKTFVEAHSDHVTVESQTDHSVCSDYGTCLSMFLPNETRSSEAMGLH